MSRAMIAANKNGMEVVRISSSTTSAPAGNEPLHRALLPGVIPPAQPGRARRGPRRRAALPGHRGHRADGDPPRVLRGRRDDARRDLLAGRRGLVLVPDPPAERRLRDLREPPREV